MFPPYLTETSFLQKIFTQANSTLHSLNSLENDINQTCISVANSSNKFKALSDTQFIESKIQEETIESNGPHTAPNQVSFCLNSYFLVFN